MIGGAPIDGACVESERQFDSSAVVRALSLMQKGEPTLAPPFVAEWPLQACPRRVGTVLTAGDSVQAFGVEVDARLIAGLHRHFLADRHRLAVLHELGL